jgi:hypothetical protein
MIVSGQTMVISELESPGNIAYFLYIQQAYKPHTAIPTRKELLIRNPHYLIKRELEKLETRKGMARYKLRED